MTRNTGQTGTLLGKIALALVAFILLAGFALAQQATCVKPCKHSLELFPLRFAVIGDRTGGAVPGVYEGIVKEIERLKPEFVVNVGDMIEGYDEDETVIRKQYEEYKGLLAPLTMPLHLVPGNHDIWADSAVGLYKEYIGEPDYSFDVRGVHFVVLDTGRYEKPEELRDDQIEWLKKDLEANKDAYYTIVIFHKPFWIETVARGKPDILHDIFAANGVDAVFTGHYHTYFSAEFDGIKYTGVGSSGGGTEEDPTGLMYHFVWATFDGKELSLAPIKAGAVLPWDQMTAEDFLFIGKMQSKGVTVQRVAVRDDLKVAKTKVAVRIENLCGAAPIEDVLKWEVPNGWEVTPAGIQVKVAAGESLTADFDVRCKGPLYPVPSFTIRCPYREGKTAQVERTLGVFRQVLALRAEAPPLIDGELKEKVWVNPTTRFFKPEYVKAEAERTEFYFAWDKDNLYLAARCTESKMNELKASVKEHDGPVHTEDCVGYFIQSEENAPVYQLYFNALGTALDQKIVIKDGEDVDVDKAWNGDYEVKTVRGDDYWTIEVRVPLGQLSAQGASGKTFALNFRRKQPRLKSAADWQTPISYDPETMGILELK